MWLRLLHMVSNYVILWKYQIYLITLMFEFYLTIHIVSVHWWKQQKFFPKYPLCTRCRWLLQPDMKHEPGNVPTNFPALSPWWRTRPASSLHILHQVRYRTELSTLDSVGYYSQIWAKAWLRRHVDESIASIKDSASLKPRYSLPLW